LKTLKRIAVLAVLICFAFTSVIASASGIVSQLGSMMNGGFEESGLEASIIGDRLTVSRLKNTSGGNFGDTTYTYIEKKLDSPLPRSGKVEVAVIHTPTSSLNIMVELYSGDNLVAQGLFTRWENAIQAGTTEIPLTKIRKTNLREFHAAGVTNEDTIILDYDANRIHLEGRRNNGIVGQTDTYFDDAGSQLTSAPSGAVPGIPIVKTGTSDKGAIDKIKVGIGNDNYNGRLWGNQKETYDGFKITHVSDSGATVLMEDSFDEGKTFADYGYKPSNLNGYVSYEGDKIAVVKTGSAAFNPVYHMPMDTTVDEGIFSLKFNVAGYVYVDGASSSDAAEDAKISFMNSSDSTVTYEHTFTAAGDKEYILSGNADTGECTLYENTADGYVPVDGAATTMTAGGDGKFAVDKIKLSTTFVTIPDDDESIVVRYGEFYLNTTPLTVQECSAEDGAVRTDATITAVLSDEVDFINPDSVVTTCNGVTVPSEAKLEDDGKTISVYYPYGLEYATDYSINIKNIVSKSMLPMTEYSADFTTEDFPLYISSIVYTDAEGTESSQSDAEKAVVTIKNDTGIDQGTYVAIVAAYDENGKLIKVSKSPVTVNSDEANVSVILGDVDAVFLKTFVWKDMKVLKALYMK